MMSLQHDVDTMGKVEGKIYPVAEIEDLKARLSDVEASEERLVSLVIRMLNGRGTVNPIYNLDIFDEQWLSDAQSALAARSWKH